MDADTFIVYSKRSTMRALLSSYGEISHATRAPGSIPVKRTFILALISASMQRESSSLTVARPVVSQRWIVAWTIAPEPVFDPEHTGSAIRYMASLPLDTNVLFMNIKATKMPFEGRG